MNFARPLQAIIPGSQGKILSVLVTVESELNVRTIARLASVSNAQASRVLAQLVDLGLLIRREVAPASLFMFNKKHVLAAPLLEIVQSRETFVKILAQKISTLEAPPSNVTIFGSFVTGEADVDSDIDIAVVRPSGVDENLWLHTVDSISTFVEESTGNEADILELDECEIGGRMEKPTQLWKDICEVSILVYGYSLKELAIKHA